MGREWTHEVARAAASICIRGECSPNSASSSDVLRDVKPLRRANTTAPDMHCPRMLCLLLLANGVCAEASEGGAGRGRKISTCVSYAGGLGDRDGAADEK